MTAATDLDGTKTLSKTEDIIIGKILRGLTNRFPLLLVTFLNGRLYQLLLMVKGG
jgi:hypothetical protein